MTYLSVSELPERAITTIWVGQCESEDVATHLLIEFPTLPGATIQPTIGLWRENGHLVHDGTGVVVTIISPARALPPYTEIAARLGRAFKQSVVLVRVTLSQQDHWYEVKLDPQ